MGCGAFRTICHLSLIPPDALERARMRERKRCLMHEREREICHGPSSTMVPDEQTAFLGCIFCGALLTYY